MSSRFPVPRLRALQMEADGSGRLQPCRKSLRQAGHCPRTGHGARVLSGFTLASLGCLKEEAWKGPTSFPCLRAPQPGLASIIPGFSESQPWLGGVRRIPDSGGPLQRCRAVEAGVIHLWLALGGLGCLRRQDLILRSLRPACFGLHGASTVTNWGIQGPPFQLLPT